MKKISINQRILLLPAVLVLLTKRAEHFINSIFRKEYHLHSIGTWTI